MGPAFRVQKTEKKNKSETEEEKLKQKEKNVELRKADEQ